MKMTLEDMLRCPRGMSFEDYQKLLTKINNLKKKIRKLHDELDFIEDGLAVLDNEQYSERWLRKQSEYNDTLDKLDKAKAQLQELEAQLKS